MNQVAKSIVRGCFSSVGLDIHRVRSNGHQSETSKCRERLAPFCTGNGIDIGPGGDPITASAVRVDLPQPYTNVGNLPVQLAGDATNLHWFRDGVLDFVYSSHVLEDFVETADVLSEWLRGLKPGGHLIIYCPDEQRFRAHCKNTGQPYNTAHKLENFSLEHVLACLEAVDRGGNLVQKCEVSEIYSWDLVWSRGLNTESSA